MLFGSLEPSINILPKSEIKRKKNYAETLLEFGEKREREDGRGVSLEASDLSRSSRFEGPSLGSRQEVRPL